MVLSFRIILQFPVIQAALRVLDVLYHPDGSKNKWWQSFSKRKVCKH